MLITLTACGKNKSTAISAPINYVPNCYDPQIAEGLELETILNNCFEGLVRIDASGNIQKAAAQAWTVSPDGLIYTFALRDDAKWYVPKSATKALGEDFVKSLDTRVTAEDFAYGIMRVLDKNTGSPYAYMLDAVNRAYATDDVTLVIELKKPFEGLLTTLALPICMPCKEAFFLETAGRYGLSTSLLLSNGPFYLGLFDEDIGAVTLKKNPDYKGSYRALSDTIRLFVPDEEKPREFSIRTASREETKDLGTEYKVSHYKNAVKAFCFNCSNETLNTFRSIRLAFAHSTDIDALVGKGISRAEGVIPSACLLQAGSSYRANANVLRGPEYDLGKADEIYRALKERNEAQEIPDDLTLNLKLVCLESDLDSVKTIMQGWQKTFGVALTLTFESFVTQEELDSVINKGDYDIAYTTIVTSDFLASEYLKNFTSDSAKNIINLQNPEFDKLVNSALNSEDSDKLTEILVECENYLLNNAYIIPTVSRDTYIVQNETAADVTVRPSGSVYAFYK
jgi:oligopeptide transport system substrate-binding protein